VIRSSLYVSGQPCSRFCVPQTESFLKRNTEIRFFPPIQSGQPQKWIHTIRVAAPVKGWCTLWKVMHHRFVDIAPSQTFDRLIIFAAFLKQFDFWLKFLLILSVLFVGDNTRNTT